LAIESENQERRPACRPVAQVVQNGVAEGSWTTVANKTSTVKGTVDANGALDLIMASWNQAGRPLEASMAGSVVGYAITASGQYRNGVAIFRQLETRAVSAF